MKTDNKPLEISFEQVATMSSKIGGIYGLSYDDSQDIATKSYYKALNCHTITGVNTTIKRVCQDHIRISKNAYKHTVTLNGIDEDSLLLAKDNQDDYDSLLLKMTRELFVSRMKDAIENIKDNPARKRHLLKKLRLLSVVSQTDDEELICSLFNINKRNVGQYISRAGESLREAAIEFGIITNADKRYL